MTPPTAPRRLTAQSWMHLAPNPGPMTLDGTNSYLLRAAPDAPAVVVDPGPDDAGHLAALAAAGPIALVLITHQHIDHTEGIDALHRATGAPVRAALAEYCRAADPLAGGEHLVVGGLAIDVVPTPGHTGDSLCFHLPDDRPLETGADTGTGAGQSTGTAPSGGSMLTGDTILGRGTTVIGIPDGSLREYLDTLRLLSGYGAIPVLPAHGPTLPDLAAVCAEYLQHRLMRLEEVRDALARLGIGAAEAEVGALTDAVYPDIDPGVRFAAEHSMAAQLAYLRGD